METPNLPTPGGLTRIAVEGPLCIYTVLGQKHQWLAALGESQGLELDLSQVDDIDSAGLQLLMLLVRESIVQGKSFRMPARSPVVQELLQFCNLTQEMEVE